MLLKGNLSELGRRLEQLEVLGELRNIQKLIIREEQNMRFVDAVMEAYDIRKDLRYKQGAEDAAHANKTIFVTNLIRSGKHTVEEIAALAEVSIDFVLNVKNTLPSA